MGALPPHPRANSLSCSGLEGADREPVAPDGMVCDSFRQGLRPTVRTHKLFPDAFQDALQRA